MATIYSLSAVENLIKRYSDKGGYMVEIKEGSLGYGTTILAGEKLKTTIIQEVYLNPWSSGHTVRMYRKCPKKYAKYLQ